jgi:hypothetical protein
MRGCKRRHPGPTASGRRGSSIGAAEAASFQRADAPGKRTPRACGRYPWPVGQFEFSLSPIGRAWPDPVLVDPQAMPYAPTSHCRIIMFKLAENSDREGHQSNSVIGKLGNKNAYEFADL